MGIPVSSPYDLTQPRRPGLNDVLIALKQNAPGKQNPPPTTAPDASEFNMLAWLAVAANQMVAVARLVVTVAAGVYSIVECKAPGSNVLTGSFTLTKNGTGDVTISWSSTLLPGLSLQPGEVQVNDTVPRIWTVYSTTSNVPAVNSPAVRIVITDRLGAAVDAPFSVRLS